MNTYCDGVLVGNWYESRAERSVKTANSNDGVIGGECGADVERVGGMGSRPVAVDGRQACGVLRPECLPAHLFFGHAPGEVPVVPQPLETATMNTLTLGEHLTVAAALASDGADSTRNNWMSAFVAANVRASAAAAAASDASIATTAQASWVAHDPAAFSHSRRAVTTREISLNGPCTDGRLPPPPPPPAPPAWLEQRLRARR